LDNNDLLRRLRYALRFDDSETSRLIKLGGGFTSTVEAGRYRIKEGEPDFTPCANHVIVHFLDGLIFDLRGPRDDKPSSASSNSTKPAQAQPNKLKPGQSPWPDRTKKSKSNGASGAQAHEHASDETTDNFKMDNNVVLKQLRIALSLRSNDIHDILTAGGSAMSESEASALFRKPDARNYRRCGDKVLRQFIAGLVKRREQQGGSGGGKTGAPNAD